MKKKLIRILASCWDTFLDYFVIKRDPIDVTEERVEDEKTGVVRIKTTTRNKNTSREKITMQYVFSRSKIRAAKRKAANS